MELFFVYMIVVCLMLIISGAGYAVHQKHEGGKNDTRSSKKYSNQNRT